MAQLAGRIRETAGAVAEIMDSYGTSIVSIFGVSFGAWMGLQLAERVHASQVVAMSPIFDLQSHLQLHSDDPEFRRWAADRFALTAESPDDGEQHIGNFTGRVVVIAHVDDEVVVPGSTLHSTYSATRLGREWSLVSVPGNHYPKASAAAEQRWAALENAIAVRPGTRRFSAVATSTG